MSGRILVCERDAFPKDEFDCGAREDGRCTLLVLSPEGHCTATEYVPLEEHERVVRERDEAQKAYDAAHSELKTACNELGACRRVADELRREIEVLRRALELLRDTRTAGFLVSHCMEQAAAELGREKGK